jgi:hypothetical protein
MLSGRSNATRTRSDLLLGDGVEQSAERDHLGLGTSQQVITSATAALAAGDVWSLREAMPLRFVPNESWLSHPTILDKVYRFVPNASTSEPALMETRDGTVVGKPAHEWSALASTTRSSSTIAIAGDVRTAYTILDRLGLTAVPIPTLFSGNTAGGIPRQDSLASSCGDAPCGRGRSQRPPGAHRQVRGEVPGVSRRDSWSQIAHRLVPHEAA